MAKGQDQISQEVQGYPDDFQDFEDTIKEVFKERRRAHLANTHGDKLEINRAISRKILSLEEPVVSTLAPVFLSIRNMFERSSSKRLGR